MSERMVHAIASWKSEGIDLSSGLDEEGLKSAFNAVGRFPPTDVLLLYGLCSGMAPLGAEDKAFFSFWPFAEAIARSIEVPRTYFPFGDGFLRAHRYSFRAETASRSSVHADQFDGNFEKLTDSVDEFFDCLLRQPGRLWLPS